MLLLALTCKSLSPSDERVAQLLLQGELNLALRTGQEMLERMADSRDPQRQALLGRVIGRAMLAAGRAEEAEELFQNLLRCYEAMSRNAVRWHASLDQAMLSLHAQKWGRAAESSNLVADDDAAPAGLQAEAMAMLAMALHRMGEHRRAVSTLNEAVRRAESAGLAAVVKLLELIKLELVARFRLETCEGLGDYALALAEGPTDPRDASALSRELHASAAEHAHHPLIAAGLLALGRWMSGEVSTPAGLAEQRLAMKWLHDRGLTVAEEALRIDIALGLLAADNGVHAAEVLGALGHNEQMAQRSRHSLELIYCSSRLHALGGRQGEALRAYKDYAKETLYRNTRERAHVPRSRFLEKQEMAEHADAAMLRLPLRYRHAYRFIIERLDDRRLSIKQVAAHIDVTERALQMAFRTHLGMTPAQLIRHHRMEGIRNELRDSSGRSSVLKTAARWGLGNRSTLAHNYRQQFAETPTATLRGAR